MSLHTCVEAHIFFEGPWRLLLVFMKGSIGGKTCGGPFHPTFSASKSFLYVQWDPEWDTQWSSMFKFEANHIGKSPGANPFDHATHSSSASNIFIRKLCSVFEVSPRKSMWCHHRHIRCLLSPLCTCLLSATHAAHTFVTASTDDEEAPLHVLDVTRWLTQGACTS